MLVGMSSCVRLGCVVLCLLVPQTAVAQEGAGFVGGLFGVTFNTVTSTAVAGQAGVHVGKGLFIFGEGGRINDVLPTDIADQIEDAEEFIESQVGLPVQINAKLPSTYVFGGARWTLPEGRIRPFLEGGAGMAHLEAKIRATVGGIPVPRELIEQFDDQGLDSNEPMLVLGGGVNVGLTRALSIDAGYRYMRVFVEDPAPTVATSVVFGAIKVSFGR